MMEVTRKQIGGAPEHHLFPTFAQPFTHLLALFSSVGIRYHYSWGEGEMSTICPPFVYQMSTICPLQAVVTDDNIRICNFCKM